MSANVSVVRLRRTTLRYFCFYLRSFTSRNPALRLFGAALRAFKNAPGIFVRTKSFALFRKGIDQLPDAMNQPEFR
jgi:hypothetical protein